MLPTKTLNPSGRIFWDNCYLFLLVNSSAINSQKKLRIFLKKIATQHKIEPLANPKSRRNAKQLALLPAPKFTNKKTAFAVSLFGGGIPLSSFS